MTAIISLAVHGAELLRTPLVFSAAREASVRIVGVVLTPSQQATVRIEQDGIVTATVEILHGGGEDGEEWIELPGTRQGRCSLSLDAANFTICVDALTATGTGNLELRMARVLQQRIGSSLPVSDAQAGMAHAVRPDEVESQCVDVSDVSALPKLLPAAFGKELREAVRPGPAALSWTGVMESLPILALTDLNQA